MWWEWLVWQAIHMTTNRYSNRDRLGRFVRRVHVDQLTVEGGWVNASDGTTHAHDRCGNLRGTTHAPGTTPDGWLCGACIDVPTPAFILARQALANDAPIGFSKTCNGCGEMLDAKKFPTYLDTGYRLRGDTCRRCEREDRTSRRSMARLAA